MTPRPDPTPFPPCPAPFNMAAHVLARAPSQPDKIAVSVLHPDHSNDLTFAALAQRVRRIAGGLHRMGLPGGAYVLMRLGDTLDFPVVFLGCIAAGLVPVVTSAQLTGPEITSMAARLVPRLIVADPGIALPDPVPCPVVAPDALDSKPLKKFIFGSPDRPAYAVFTSGTSGKPSPVLHAHRAIWARGMMTDGWYGLTKSDRVLHAGAFNWTYTLGTGLMDPWVAGATALIAAPGTSTTALPGLLARHRATIFAAAPGVYRQMLRAPVPPLPDLRHGLSAGEKMPRALHAAFAEATGRQVHEAFGMSECSTFISGSPARPAPPGTLGYPQPGRQVAVLGPDHRPADIGTPGVIAIGAGDPGLMLGHPGDPKGTTARYTPDKKWFLTGDTGSMGTDGAITYLGRADDLMNAGGFRVSPLEVEATMTTHPALQDAAAFEARIKGDTTIIALAFTADIAPPQAELTAFAATRLARYKCPRLFIHLPALPRGANGKILRRQLRQDFEDPDDQA